MRFLLALLLFPLFSSSQSDDKYPSLLWKISGKGLKKPSYLYGTMHVSNRAAYYLSEEFFNALKSVDRVGLETNPGDWLENMEKTGELSELNLFRSSSGDYRNFYKYTFGSEFPSTPLLQSLLSYDPDIINGLLYRQHRSRENFEESTYIDLFIYQTAMKLNKEVISLEPFITSEIFARLASLPDTGELSAEANYNYRDYQELSRKIEDAYREARLQRLDSLSKLSSSANTVRFLINERNRVFVRSMDSVMTLGSVFSGVGAAHLPGEEGMIELLRQMGYSVEPVKPNFTRKSIQLREKFEQQAKAVAFQKVFSGDSLFELNLPGKLYPVASIDNLKYYLYPDMLNGSFYSVARLRYLGPLYGESRENMLRRVDQLLFEHIPGKILSKKEFQSAAGMPVIEIVNKTRRGDVQKYQMVFTDLELIIFKMGGKGEYVLGNEGKNYFSSIQLHPKPSGWSSYSPATGGFTCNLPGDRHYDKLNGSPLRGITEDLYAYDAQKKTFVGLKHAVFNDFSYLEEDSFELNQFAKHISASYGFSLETSRELRSEQNLPCIRFSGKNSKGDRMFAKVFIKGQHYYFVYLLGPDQTGFEHPFFTSLKLGDFRYVHPSKSITDRDFYFTVMDEVTDDPQSRFNEQYARAYAKYMASGKRRQNAYDTRIDNKYYYSPSSNECININLDKYNDYDYRDSLELENRIVKRYQSNGSFILQKKPNASIPGMFHLHYVLKDTATSRAIDCRLFLRRGILLEINAPFDTLVGIQGWTKSFMESFRPMDTLIGKPVFENKFDQLLADLCSSDTLVRNMANTTVKNSISLQKAYARSFIRFMESPDLKKVNEESKAQLFVSGGSLETEDILPVYRKVYAQYTDSFYLQLCLLKGLTFLKTQKSYQTFYDLLQSEVPLVGAEGTVSDVFASLYDSLELCRGYFPGLLSLTRYDEYREPVYALMAELVQRKLIQPASYQALLDNIVTDANLSMKRFNPSAQRSFYQENNPNGYNNLDKTSRELADNLQSTLSGLQNNRLHKGSNYLRMLDAFNRLPLVNYAIVLAPHYKQHAKTRQFFEGLSKNKFQSVAMPVHIELLKYKVVLNDTLNSYYCRNKYTRAYFYSELEKAGLLERFDKSYATQKALAESFVNSQRQLSSFYAYERDRNGRDSLLFVKEIPVKNKYQQGSLYLYRNQKLKPSEQKWSSVFVPEGKGLNVNMELFTMDYQIDPEKSFSQNEQDLAEYFYYGFRKRAMEQEEN